VLTALGGIDLLRVPVAVREALRLGAYQILFLDRVPSYAAVSDSVSLARRASVRAAGFANAVLRKVAASGRETFAQLSEGGDPASLAIRYSTPRWLVDLWLEELGRELAETAMGASCHPPERCLRVNRRRATPEQARASLAAEGVALVPVDGFPDALVVAAGPAMETTKAFADGLITPQSRGSQLVSAVACGGSPGARRVVDLCAAPGGKLSHLADLLPEAHLCAYEIDPARAGRLRRNLARLGIQAEVIVGDATGLAAPPAPDVDLVLVDAPCSGLGVLASRPDLRWRRGAGSAGEHALTEERLLAAGAALVAPGGSLIYAVCTLTRRETVDVLAKLLDGGEWQADDLGVEFPHCRHPDDGRFLLTVPGVHGSSGFFITRLRRVTRRATRGSMGPR